MTLEQVTPSGVERSAANFSDIDFSSPYSDVSLSSQRTAIKEMRSSSAASGAFLPDVEIIPTKSKGMEVGLSLSRTIVESHGGRITVEPNPGGGTIFRFTLRRVVSEERPNGR